MEHEEFDKLIRGKNINFLIGAGASMPIYKCLSLGENKPTFEEVVSNKKLSKKANIFMYIYYFLGWVEPMGKLLDNFSESMTGKETFENYKRLINCFYNYLQGESNERPKRINVFTTNYDLLFETIFDTFLFDNPLIYFNDGSRGVFRKYISNKNYYLNVTHSGYNDNYRREVPTVNLFKLHGSVSWKVSSDRILVCEKNNILFSIKETINKLNLEYKKIEDIIKNTPSESIDTFIYNINIAVENLDLDLIDLYEFYDLYKKIPIINPNKYKFFKTVSEQHYYQLIRSFSYELEQKQSILIVFGFSFADEHIKDILERSLLNPELHVILISYSKEDKEKLKKIFGGYKNIKFLPSKTEGINGDFRYLLSLLGDNNEE